MLKQVKLNHGRFSFRFFVVVFWRGSQRKMVFSVSFVEHKELAIAKISM